MGKQFVIIGGLVGSCLASKLFHLSQSASGLKFAMSASDLELTPDDGGPEEDFELPCEDVGMTEAEVHGCPAKKHTK